MAHRISSRDSNENRVSYSCLLKDKQRLVKYWNTDDPEEFTQRILEGRDLVLIIVSLRIDKQKQLNTGVY